MHRSAAGTVPHATRPSGRRRALTAAGLAGSLLATFNGMEQTILTDWTKPPLKPIKLTDKQR